MASTVSAQGPRRRGLARRESRAAAVRRPAVAVREPELRPLPVSAVRSLHHQVLRTDAAGMPLEWID